MTELKEEKKTGLVLEGGGMRGIYTAGVLDVFLDHDISFDGVIGVSAGAVHGASFVSGQKERSIRYYKKYCNDKRFMSFKNWWTSSSASMIYRNGWIRMITRHLTGEIHGFMWHAAMWRQGKQSIWRSNICSKMSNISVRRHPFRMCPIWSRLVE